MSDIWQYPEYIHRVPTTYIKHQSIKAHIRHCEKATYNVEENTEILQKMILLIFAGCAGSSLLFWLFSSRRWWELLFTLVCSCSFCTLSLLWHTFTTLASLLRSTGSGARRRQQLQLSRSTAQAQQLQCAGFVAPQHVGSSWIGIKLMSPALVSRFFDHKATWEA